MIKKMISAEESSIASEEIQQQARFWLRILTSGDVKSLDAQGFQRWLRASPEHKVAFQEVKQRWETIKSGAGELLRVDPEAAAFHRQNRSVAKPGRRAFLAGAASTAAVAGVSLIYPPAGLWPSLAEWSADYRTVVGEQRSVVLDERVHVTLNTQTSIRRESTNNQTTGINLLTGEAAIDLAAVGPSFNVVAGAGRSLAELGRFEVRHVDDKVCVTCFAGYVRVEHPSGERSIQPGQQIEYDANSIRKIVAVSLADVSAWRNGELKFNQAKLQDVLAEINRYRPGRVVLMNAALRDSTVSGSFFIASLDSALAQLQHTFSLQARALPGGLLVLS